MNRRGFTLIELLVAIVLCAMASVLVYRVFAGGMKLSGRMRESLRTETRVHFLFAQTEKDLKNAVLFKDAPFRGDNFSMRFATLDQDVIPVRYEYRNGSVHRMGGRMERGTELARDLKSFSIEYAYEDKSGEIVFQPYWTGLLLPKAVKLSAGQLSTLVVLPQGQMGKIGS